MFSFTKEEKNTFASIIEDLEDRPGCVVFPQRGTLDTAMWLTEVGYLFRNDEFMDLIETSPEIAEWLYQHENPPLSSEIFERAVYRDDLNAMIWLQKHICPHNKFRLIPVWMLWEILDKHAEE